MYFTGGFKDQTISELKKVICCSEMMAKLGASGIVEILNGIKILTKNVIAPAF